MMMGWRGEGRGFIYFGRGEGGMRGMGGDAHRECERFLEFSMRWCDGNVRMFGESSGMF